MGNIQVRGNPEVRFWLGSIWMLEYFSLTAGLEAGADSEERKLRLEGRLPGELMGSAGHRGHFCFPKAVERLSPREARSPEALSVLSTRGQSGGGWVGTSGPDPRAGALSSASMPGPSLGPILRIGLKSSLE